MKMLVVSNMYPSDKDPSYGTFVRNFYEDMSRRNGRSQTSLITIRGRRKSKWVKIFTYISFYTRLLTKVLFEKYDIIYVHTVTFPTPALRLAAIFKSLPMIFNVHGDDVLPSNRMKRFLRDLSKPLVTESRLVVAPSEYFRNVVCDVFPGVAPERVFVSPSGGINHIFFHPKEKINFGEKPLTLGFVSRIDVGKGWDTYIDAIKLLSEEGIACRGIIAGGGSQVQDMLSEISKNNLAETISFIGPQSQEDLAKLYPTFDIFIFPSTREAESLGLVGLEAMAAGVPVIAANMAGPTSYVIPGYNGYLFEPHSSIDLAECIKKFLSLPNQERLNLSDNAYTQALRYESDYVAEELYHLINNLR